MDMTRTALLLCDMQNGFMHPAGAYGRGGATAPSMPDIVPRVRSVAEAMRAAGGWVVSTHFTLIAGRNGEPMISPHLKRLRPFLGGRDFAPGSFDSLLIEELRPADLSVEKVAFSAFYMSRLEWILRKSGIETIYFAGVVTNGGVASTLRDAHVRDFHCILLEDGCAAFKQEIHDAAVRDMSSIAEVVTCAVAAARIHLGA